MDGPPDLARLSLLSNNELTPSAFRALERGDFYEAGCILADEGRTVRRSTSNRLARSPGRRGLTDR